MLRPGSTIARLVAVAVLAIILLVGYQWIIAPIFGAYRDNQTMISRSNEMLLRHRAVAAEQSDLAEQLAVLEQDDQSMAGYFEASGDAVATARLQDLATEVIDAAGGEVTSTQSLPATAIEGAPAIRRAGLKIRFNATIDSLADTLQDLETTEPYVFIETLTMATRRAERTGIKSENNPQLDIKLDLVGYVRPSDR